MVVSINTCNYNWKLHINILIKRHQRSSCNVTNMYNFLWCFRFVSRPLHCWGVAPVADGLDLRHGTFTRLRNHAVKPVELCSWFHLSRNCMGLLHSQVAFFHQQFVNPLSTVGCIVIITFMWFMCLTTICINTHMLFVLMDRTLHGHDVGISIDHRGEYVLKRTRKIEIWREWYMYPLPVPSGQFENIEQ